MAPAGERAAAADFRSVNAIAAKLDALPAAIAAAVVAALPPTSSVTTSGDVEVTGTLHVGGTP